MAKLVRVDVDLYVDPDAVAAICADGPDACIHLWGGSVVCVAKSVDEVIDTLASRIGSPISSVVQGAPNETATQQKESPLSLLAPAAHEANAVVETEADFVDIPSRVVDDLIYRIEFRGKWVIAFMRVNGVDHVICEINPRRFEHIPPIKRADWWIDAAQRNEQDLWIAQPRLADGHDSTLIRAVLAKFDLKWPNDEAIEITYRRRW